MHNSPDCTGIWETETLWPDDHGRGTDILRCSECGRAAHMLSEHRALRENELNTMLRTLEGDGRKLIPNAFNLYPTRLPNRLAHLLGNQEAA